MTILYIVLGITVLGVIAALIWRRAALPHLVELDGGNG